MDYDLTKSSTTEESVLVWLDNFKNPFRLDIPIPAGDSEGMSSPMPPLNEEPKPEK